MASDAWNESPEQVCKIKGCKNFARDVFNVSDTFPISWKVVHTVVVVKFVHRVNPRFARFQENSRKGLCANFQRKPRRMKARVASKVICHDITEMCRKMTPTCLCSTFETLLSGSASKPDFLFFNEERARAWTPPQSATKAAGSCLVSDCQFRKIQLPEQNFFQAQTHADSFVTPSAVV